MRRGLMARFHFHSSSDIPRGSGDVVDAFVEIHQAAR